MLASQYFYDVFGRRIGSLLPIFYGWAEDRLTLTQLPAQDHRPMRRIHTLHEPHSQVPLLHVETAGLPPEVSLADLWEQDSGHTTDARQRSMLAEVLCAASARPQHPRPTTEAFTRMQQP